ncbi:MAG: protein-L-isoaspartate(D-aspartate) O-methyltransferase [Pseudomonadales bacterium]
MTSLADSFDRYRKEMVTTIEEQVVETAAYIGKSMLDQRVMEAMASVPRQKFVPEMYKDSSYRDGPLPIGHNQTISQPYIVALMTDLINPQPDDVVLEVGTGSGYQAAILSQLVTKVYSIEIVAPLAATAAEVLGELGYNNVAVIHGNGYKGCLEHAPFDAIIVTAGGNIPPLLIEQLKPGGRMVIPVGGVREVQYLTLLDKSIEGDISHRRVLPVRFVPLIGGD